MHTSPRSLRRLRVLAIGLSLVVVLTTWSYLGDVFRVYPSWLSVGDVTVHVLTVPPALLGLVVVVGARVRALKRGESSDHRLLLEVVLAVVVLLSAAYAVVDLNRSNPGVYASGLVPVVFGLLLALVLLVGEGLAAARRYRLG